MSRAVEDKQGGIHLRVDIPDRLNGSKAQQQALASQIQTALTDEIASENEACGISIERFDVSSSLFSAERATTLTEDDIREELCNVRGLESGHTLSTWTPGKTAIVVSFKSRREDIVLAKILERLKDDAKRQFTRQLPALICVHMAELSEKQLLDIAEVDNLERDLVADLNCARDRVEKDRQPAVVELSIQAETGVDCRVYDLWLATLKWVSEGK
jgi:5-carboxymethyl-2-hydroxymuconate isomerase